jgi:intracellular sulfur oxidation DsrE/DsrF family protein
MSKDTTYGAKHAAGGNEIPNPNGALIDALRAKGVRVIVCGQSAAAYDVQKADLYPGVEMALSAMTAHALLQQQGYTLNPF